MTKTFIIKAAIVLALFLFSAYLFEFFNPWCGLGLLTADILLIIYFITNQQN